MIILDRHGNISVHDKIEDLPSSLLEGDSDASKALKSNNDGNQDKANTALPPVPAPKSEQEKLDLKRKTGDMSLYAYYFRSIGWIRGVAFLGLAIVYIFLGKFPRKSSPSEYDSCTLTETKEIWLEMWIGAGTSARPVMYISVYVALAAGCTVAAFLSMGSVTVLADD